MNILTQPLLVLATFTAAGAYSAPVDTPPGRQLQGKVGPGFTITLQENGQPVTSLRPGTYWLTVDDLADAHNFHIRGPGLDDVVTSVPFMGTVTHKIHLRHGTYTFQCDPHAPIMFGTFTVGGVGQGH
jgi:hypothetical protein